jgi:beta-lactamase class C
MRLLKLLTVTTCFLTANTYAAGEADQSKIKETIDKAIRPVMQAYKIPGMAIAVTIDAKRYFYNYGVASRKTKRPITSATLFELGSISKTFTGTLAAYAQVNGKLSLTDSPSKYLPSLLGSSFDKVTLLNLGTYTAGGLPLQVPDNIDTTGQLIDYFKAWQPTYPSGTRRTYSNPSIGMLGMVAASSMRLSFDDAIEKQLFRQLGMANSYINVPTRSMSNYAQGYTEKDAPVRMNPGVVASEAYGVKSGSADMIRFIEANMEVIKLDGKLRRAIADTHKGYFKAGDMIQGLVWEQYPYPVALKQLLAGNSDTIIFDDTVVSSLIPPLQPQSNVLINKTGSTNGFGGYVAFIPAQKLGIVILANKNYPIDARVTAAYQILTALDRQAGPQSAR